MREYPPRIEIKPLDRPVNATIRVPGSKSITNRALILGALLKPLTGCVIENALFSEDTLVMIEGLRTLGFRVTVDQAEDRVHILRETTKRLIPVDSADVFVGNSGTTMRFLTALVALGTGRYCLDGVARMRERPMGDLLDALNSLGSETRAENDDGCPPVVVSARGLRGGQVRIRGDASSQFLSGLLMVAPFADGDTAITVDGPLVSSPYVGMTVRMMRDFGIDVATDGATWFQVPKASYYIRDHYAVEPDASSASYFLAAAAITGGQVSIPGLGANSLQSDARFGDVVNSLALRGIDIDMNAISDTVMTLAAVACFAEGPTTIRNVAHIRHKESDRIAALATELRKLGVEVDEFPDGLRITPRPMHGAEIETYNDHRMAMSMALIGLKVPGVIIKNPGCVAKTYPGFWEDFEKLYG